MKTHEDIDIVRPITATQNNKGCCTVFSAVVVSGCKDSGISCSRGALSKLAAQHEMGAVFSVIGIGEALLPLAVSPVYTAVYNSTLEVFPGTVFLVLASVSVVIATIYV